MEEKLLHYRTNNVSSIQGNKNKNIYDAFEALMYLERYLRMKDKYLLYKESYLKMACGIIVYTLARSDNDQFKEIIRNPIIAGYIKNMINSYEFNHINLQDEVVVVYGAGVLAQVFIRCLKMMVLTNQRIYVGVSDKVEN